MHLLSEFEGKKLMAQIEWSKFPDFIFVKKIYSLILCKKWDPCLDIFENDFHMFANKLQILYDGYDSVKVYSMYEK